MSAGMGLLVVLVAAMIGVADSETRTLDRLKSCPSHTTPTGTYTIPVQAYENNCTMEATGANLADTEISLVLMIPFIGDLNDVFTGGVTLVQMALDDIQNSSYLPGYRVKLYITDDGCTTQDSLAGLARQLQTPPLKHGVLGPGCSDGSGAVNDMLQYWNLLQLGTIALSNAMSDPVRYPNYIRMTPSLAVILDGAYNFIKFMGWKRVGFVRGLEKPDIVGFGSMYLNARIGGDLQYLAAAPSHPSAYAWTVLMQADFKFDALNIAAGRASPAASIASVDAAVAMVKKFDARITIFLGYDHEAAWFWCAAHRAGIKAPDYTWIVGTGWLGPYFMYQWAPRVQMMTGGACTPSDIFTAGFGAILTYVSGSSLKLTHEMSGRPNRDIQGGYLAGCSQMVNGTPYCGFGVEAYIYDSIWHFARIMHQYLVDASAPLASVNTPTGATSLFGLSLQSDYTGFSGQVNFFNPVIEGPASMNGAYGDRIGDSMARQFTHPDMVNDPFSMHFRKVAQMSIRGVVDIILPLTWDATDPTKKLECSAPNTCDFTNGWLNVDRNETCEAGRIWKLTKGCDECPAGKYSALGEVVCSSCSEGTFTGVPGMSECGPCALGTAAKTSDATKCDECNPGTFAGNTGMSLCAYCATGRYTNATGAAICDNCLENTGDRYPTTVSTGSRGVSDCACEENFYMASSDGLCKACMEGLDCPVGSNQALIPQSAADPVSSLPHPKPMPKYYTAYADPLSVFECFSKTACPGGRPEACGAFRSEIACGLCAEGYYSDTEGDCQKCASSQGLLEVWIVLCSVLGPVVVLLVTWNQPKEPLLSWHNPLNGMITMGTVIVAYAQIIALNANMKLEVPDLMKDMGDSTSFTLSPLKFIHPQCSSARDFGLSLAIQLVMPLYFAAICGCAGLLSSIINKFKPDFPTLWPNAASIFGNVYAALYIAVAAATFQLFMCFEHPNGKQTLRAANYILCKESYWNSLVAGSAFAISVFCVGALALFATLLYVMPRYYQVRSFRISVRFLIFKYRVGYGFWTIALLTKGLWVTLSTVLFTSGALQILWLNFGIIVYVLAAMLFMPFRHMAVNIVDVIAHSFILFAYNVSTIWANPEPEILDPLATINAIVIMGMYPVFFGAFVYQVRLVFLRQKAPEKFAEIANKLASEVCETYGNIEGQKKELKEVFTTMSIYEKSLFRSARNILVRECGDGGPLLEGSVEPRLSKPGQTKVPASNTPAPREWV